MNDSETLRVQSAINTSHVNIGSSATRVSVIVPNWNGLRFIGMCLDSLKRSSFDDFEVIVVDNGSVDGSRELMEEKYPWIRLIKLPKTWALPLPAIAAFRRPGGSTSACSTTTSRSSLIG